VPLQSSEELLGRGALELPADGVGLVDAAVERRTGTAASAPPAARVRRVAALVTRPPMDEGCTDRVIGAVAARVPVATAVRDAEALGAAVPDDAVAAPLAEAVAPAGRHGGLR
jgi:hypothetical protein